jgi:hypothetical protein
MASFRELILGAERPDLEAYLAGLEQGEGVSLHPVFNELRGVRCEGPVERLLEKLHLEAPESHLILPADEATRLLQALAAPGAGAPHILLHADREIREAWFEYRFGAYARPDAVAIRQALAALPEGVAAEGAVVREEENPEAKGPELYAPLHAYVFSGHGRLRGPFAPVLALREKLAALPMMEAGEVALVFREPGPAWPDR